MTLRPLGSVPRGQTESRRAAPSGVITVVLVAGLVITSLGLRIGDLGRGLWIDEGISVGVASHRLSEIPGLLAQDGSPPLYYVLLHGWMALFGSSEQATHALSLVLALLAPCRAVDGLEPLRSAGGMDAGGDGRLQPLPELFRLRHAHVRPVGGAGPGGHRRVPARLCLGRRRYLWLFAVSLALVLYTHNWGLWLAVGFAMALGPCAIAAADRRRIWRDAAMSFGAVAVAYLPWLPTLAYQRAHTGAPWSPARTPGRSCLCRQCPRRPPRAGAGGPVVRGRPRAVVGAAPARLPFDRQWPAWPPWPRCPLARALAPGLGAGDLVIVMQMEEVPVLANYLPKGLLYATATGPVADPGIADWRDALARTRAATVGAALAPQLDRSAVGTDVVLVCSQPGTGPTALPWFALMERHCADWRAALGADARFAPVPVPGGGCSRLTARRSGRFSASPRSRVDTRPLGRRLRGSGRHPVGAPQAGGARRDRGGQHPAGRAPPQPVGVVRADAGVLPVGAEPRQCDGDLRSLQRSRRDRRAWVAACATWSGHGIPTRTTRGR